MAAGSPLTIPNAISALRLLGIPLYVWLILSQGAYGLAVIVLGIAGATDWIDGYLARRLNQQSRLGEILDPLADRLYIAATIISLALVDLIPWWLVGVLVARDVLLVLLVPILRRQGLLTLPVTLLGKAATFALFWGFPFLLLSGVGGALGSLASVVGWAFALWGTYLYWMAGLGYVRTALGYSAGVGTAPQH
jgi:cardiolipin synthase (CMP-forming)